MSRTLVLGGAQRQEPLRRAAAARARRGPLRGTGVPRRHERPGLGGPGRAAPGPPPPGWKTLETLDLADAIRAATTPVLVDCLGLWLTRFVDGIGGWESPQETSIAVAWAVRDLAEAWENAPTEVVAVSNEVGWGVVPSTTAGGLFRDELGRLNATLSSRSDRVALVVAGRVLDLSDAPVVGE